MITCVLASGNGSNFEALVNNGVKVDLLITNKPNAYCLERAKNLNIKAVVVESLGQDHLSYEQAVLQVLKDNQVELILLAGYMKIIKETILDVYEGMIINIHPSYLPDFKGAHAIKEAYEAQVEYSGVTVHIIDKNIDEGVYLAQEKVMLDPSDTLDEFEAKIHQVEYQLYHQTVKQFIKERKLWKEH